MNKRTKIMIGCGIFCVLISLISTWYAVKFNNSRLVTPMDFNNYTFQAKDLPMILSISLTCIYVIALFVILFWGIGRKNKGIKETNTTFKINPQLGYLGFLGFLGFSGFWSYSVNGSISSFVFFLFFGFFGFYYGGKMSGTYMDERFKENAMRAQLLAYKITVSIIFISILILSQRKLFGNLEYTLIAVVIIISLALALGIFLSGYLLYRFDYDEQSETDEE